MRRLWLDAFEGCTALNVQVVFFTQKARAEPGLREELGAGQAALFLRGLSRWPAGPSSEHDSFREVRILKCGQLNSPKASVLRDSGRTFKASYILALEIPILCWVKKKKKVT